MITDHTEFMGLALQEARKAEQWDEVPIGAVLIDSQGEILCAAHNRTVGLTDPTAHAEINVLREAAQKVMNYRLVNTSLYVTIEPCIMCMGAIINARVSRVVFGAPDPKWGGAGSLYNFAGDSRLNHHPEIISGICEQECRLIIQEFFSKKR
jgi:tRNA(adenine34) deaminase